NGETRCRSASKPKTWRNYYATVFEDSGRTAVYSLQNWDRLYRETYEFKEALFSSTLPSYVIDAVSANISILKTPTVMRLEDGSLYGWEGCHPSSGCCEGSCTHVWNYAYALPFLFPKLERSMRSLDYRYNQREDGRMSFRLQLPLGSGFSEFPHACADGQFGGVVKAYRDWKISGDTAWLRSHWEAVKKSIEYAWAETNEDKWDLDKDGVLEGRQHHTLDMELFGPNSWLTGFYLAALKAGAEMADHLGEHEKAQEYRELFERGKSWVDEHLFNGDYYHQLIDVRDRSVLERFKAEDPKVVDTYWDEEHGEVKYQVAEGCGIDQVVAQWHANLSGLGEVFDREQTRKALSSIFRYNFKRRLRDFFNPCRVFSLNDESGVVICDWPEGKRKPAVPVPYSEETMCGFEYAVACLMIQEGLLDEGLEIVKAVRERFDGERRNPWNEFECGSNYARSMASYALLLALSGFRYNLVNGTIGFNPPRLDDGSFKCFWSLGTGWGTFEATPERFFIRVHYGQLGVKKIELPLFKGRRVKSVSVGGSSLPFEEREGTITLAKPALVKRGEELQVSLDQ
ncbi:MAG: GH116 family glycosyl hydrolase, partial [Candidatus Bathyarchaeia archaeon]